MLAGQTTLSSAVRSIASSKAFRSFALVASGVPTFVYGRLPTPLLVADVERDRLPAESASLQETRRLECSCTAGRPVGETESSAWRSPAFSAATAAAASVIGLEDDLVEVDVLPVVVVRRLDHGDVVAGDAVVVHERADADRLLAEVVAELGQLRRRT